MIRDGGELQIGIGSLGDAIVYFLNLRHLRATIYQETLELFSVPNHFGEIISKRGATAPFSEGLYCATEMVVDGFLHLLESGILKREVFEDLAIQRLLNQGLITSKVTSNTVALLQLQGAISLPLSVKDIKYLKKFGILNEQAPEQAGLQWEDYLGDTLKGGIIIHGGFFLGPSSFYQKLQEMPVPLKKKINMTSVCRINQLYGHEELDRLHRKNARFINTTLMVTLSGAAISDGLDGNRVLSGVGGQYNFVAMAHELPDGHSILCFRSTRTSQGKVQSTIVWEYPHVTIPRHLRDIFVNEYGIADLRGKTDEEIIQALLNITDSRFQEELAFKAKRAGKLRADYEIPPAFRNNFPAQISEKLGRLRGKIADFTPPFPFGSEFTKDELRLGKVLKKLKSLKEDKRALILKIVKSLVQPVKGDSEAERLLKMMRLNQPQNLNEKIIGLLLRQFLAE